MSGFGSYIDTGSPLHRLHPGVKISILFLIMIFTLAYPYFPGIIITAAVLFFLHSAGRIPLRKTSARMLRVLPLIVLVLAIRILLVPGKLEDEALFSVLFIRITAESLMDGVEGTSRLAGLVLLFSLFSKITSQGELTYGIEALTRPLGRIKFPAHEFALVLIIAFRFLPLVSMESERLIRAQTARGADFTRMRGGIFARARAFLPLLIPLFIATLKRAETMAMALETRCYRGGAGRTRFVRYKTGSADIFAGVITAVYATAAVILYFHR